MKWLSLVLLPIACSNLFGIFAVISGYFGLYWLSNSPIRVALVIVGILIAVMAIRKSKGSIIVMQWLFITASVGSIVTLAKGVEINSTPAIVLSIVWGVAFSISAALSHKYQKQLLKIDA
jgi:hypothetical protein